MLRNRSARETDDRRRQILEADQLVGHHAARAPWRKVFPFFGNRDDKGNLVAQVDPILFSARNAFPVVGIEKDDRVVAQSVVLQPFEKLAHPNIREPDRIVHARELLAHFGAVFQKWRHHEFVVPDNLFRPKVCEHHLLVLIEGQGHGPRLMRIVMIENAEERLIVFATPPTDLAIEVPRLFDHLVNIGDVIVPLAAVGREIARLLHVDGEALNEVREGILTPVVSRSELIGFNPCNNRRATR